MKLDFEKVLIEDFFINLNNYMINELIIDENDVLITKNGENKTSNGMKLYKILSSNIIGSLISIFGFY